MNANGTITIEQFEAYDKHMKELHAKIIGVQDERIAFQKKIVAELKAENERLRTELVRAEHNALMRFKQWRETVDAFTEGESGDWLVVADYTGPEVYDTENKAIGAANRNAEEGQKSVVVQIKSVVDIPHHAMTKDDEIQYAEGWKENV